MLGGFYHETLNSAKQFHALISCGRGEKERKHAGIIETKEGLLPFNVDQKRGAEVMAKLVKGLATI